MYATKADYTSQNLSEDPSGNILTVEDATQFRASAIVYLSCSGLPTKELLVREVLSKTTLSIIDSSNQTLPLDYSQYGAEAGAILTQPEQDVYQTHQGYPDFLEGTGGGSLDSAEVAELTVTESLMAPGAIATIGQLTVDGLNCFGSLFVNTGEPTTGIVSTGNIKGNTLQSNTTITAVGNITGANLSGTNTGNVTIATANGLSISGQALSLALATGAVPGAVSTGAQTFAGVKTFSSIPVFSAGISVNNAFNVSSSGKISYSTVGDSTATPGDATLNTVVGKSAFPSTTRSITITNSLVTANSIVQAWIQQSGEDSGMSYISRVSVSSGSFTIYGNAEAANVVTVCWEVKN